MATIHPTALVDRVSELAADVRVEAYAVIGPGVSIGPRTVVGPHSIVQGSTVIGSDCQVGPAAYVGFDPQHLEFLRRPLEERQQSWLVIGDGVIIREGVSIHRASRPGQANATRVGSHCLLMGGAHVAHDCVVAEHVIMANTALLGGHCQVGARAFLGGGCTVHQFVRIGRLAMVGGNQPVGHDAPPFAALLHGGLKGYNAVGCRRAGMSAGSIKAVRAAFYCYHTHRTMPAAIEAMRAAGLDQAPEVRELIEFLTTTKRGIQASVRFLNYLRTTAPADDERE
jgi:UDP-N-acetylglucosamine acyltransferase